MRGRLHLAAALFVLHANAADPIRVRPVDPSELPASLRVPSTTLDAINQATAARIREGEADHLIFYALQSTRFTTLPRIEPALSARAWHEAKAIPPDAARRLEAFRAARPEGVRHLYFAKMLAAGLDLNAEYERAMRFLYEKEWDSRAKSGAARRQFIAGLYQTRGHSTDSNLEANYTVHTALQALKAGHPNTHIRRVLLIGPGMDWAPRTALHDEPPPQSYQPYALADSLIRTGLSRLDTLQIDAADVNPRVLEHLAAFPESDRRLTLRYPPGDEPWNDFFTRLGQAVGTRTHYDGHETLTVSRPAAELIHPLRMNIVTERTDPPAQYDLIVATNVLLYFDEGELGLALANAASALTPGGFLIHNDTRAEIESLAQTAGIPIVNARMVRLNPRRDLYDAAVLHQRPPKPQKEPRP